MPPTSQTASSTPRLSEYARKFVYPDGIVRTVWPRVEAKGRELGLGFDWWQAQCGTVCLGYRENGQYAASIGGVGMSIPRQVGKTYFVLALLIIMCILFPGLQVVWSAHHLRTSTKTFTTLRGICRRKKVAPYIARNDHGGDAIRTSNGQQEVRFLNGSCIMFGARAQGFGRGFDEIDIEVFDEAQILDTKALEDIIAATNQARHEHGALLFFMGTPPRPTDPSEAFGQRRAEAWSGTSEDAVWLEMGADPKSSPDDRSQWPLMNPSYPLRTPGESLLRLRKNLGNDDSWNREGRGIWDDDSTPGGIVPIGAWLALVDPDPSHAPERMASFAIEVDLDRTFGSIGAAGKRDDGRLHLELVDRRRGTAWIVGRAVELNLEHGDLSFVVDGGGPARDLIPELEAAGLYVVRAETEDVTTAAAGLVDWVRDGIAVHGPQSELDDAITGAKKRPLGDGAFAIGRKKSDVDVTPLVAVTLAGWLEMSASDLNVW